MARTVPRKHPSLPQRLCGDGDVAKLNHDDDIGDDGEEAEEEPQRRAV